MQNIRRLTLICYILPFLMVALASETNKSASGTSIKVDNKPPSHQLDASDYKAVKRTLDNLLNRLDKLDPLYFGDMDTRTSSILTTVNGLDSKLRALQEKTQVWEIIHHQMDAIADHIDTVDRKIDVMRQSRDDLSAIEGRLTTIEYLMRRQLNGEKVHLEEKDHSQVFGKKNTMDEGIKGVKRSILKEAKEPEVGRGDFDWQKVGRTEERPSFKPTYGRFERVLLAGGGVSAGDLAKPLEKAQFGGAVERDQERSTGTKIQVEDTSERNENHNQDDQFTRDSFEVISEKLQVIDERIFQQSTILNRISGQVAKLESHCRCECLKQDGQPSTPSTPTTTHRRTDPDQRNGPEERERPERPTKPKGSEVSVTTDTQNDNAGPETVPISPSKIGCQDLRKQHTENVLFQYQNSSISSLTNHTLDVQLCYHGNYESGWTVLQRRGAPFQARGQVENFNRSWSEYKNGFGSLNNEFWYGNDLIHQMTGDDDVELRILLEDWNGTKLEMEYGLFRIESEEYQYNLMIGEPKFGREPLDSLTYHNGQDFSTFDRRNDKTTMDHTRECCSCAVSYGSGWWFNNCIEANLNGLFRQTPKDHNYVGIIWEGWHGDYSLKSTRMMIRSKPVDDEEEARLGRTPPDDP